MTTADNLLIKEFEFYLANQTDLVEKYNGRVLAIKNQKVIGDYESYMEAIEETKKDNELGTFLVQLCTPGERAYTMEFHSMVSF